MGQLLARIPAKTVAIFAGSVDFGTSKPGPGEAFGKGFQEAFKTLSEAPGEWPEGAENNAKK